MQRKWRRGRWAAVSLLTIIPLTAILHHAVFFRPTCMLNPTFGEDYYPEVVSVWLRNDPSLPLAFVGSLVVWMAGLYRPPIRLWTVAFFIAFLPLIIWIWDIPFTGRIVCATLHDGRTWLHTRHLYLLGAALWVPIALLLRRAGRVPAGNPQATSSPSKVTAEL